MRSIKEECLDRIIPLRYERAAWCASSAERRDSTAAACRHHATVAIAVFGSLTGVSMRDPLSARASKRTASASSVSR